MTLDAMTHTVCCTGQLGVVIMCDKCTDYSKTEDNDDIPISHRKSMPYTLASMQPLVQNF